MMNTDKLEAMLIRHEGLKLKPYKDTMGIPTIGIGRNLEEGISKGEALYLFQNDLSSTVTDLQSFPWFSSLDEVRKAVLIDMCFNMGINRLRGFVVTLKAIKDGRYEDAAQGMLKSLWAAQVGYRAQELAEMMRTGEWQ